MNTQFDSIIPLCICRVKEIKNKKTGCHKFKKKKWMYTIKLNWTASLDTLWLCLVPLLRAANNKVCWFKIDFDMLDYFQVKLIFSPKFILPFKSKCDSCIEIYCRTRIHFSQTNGNAIAKQQNQKKLDRMFFIFWNKLT